MTYYIQLHSIALYLFYTFENIDILQFSMYGFIHSWFVDSIYYDKCEIRMRKYNIINLEKLDT